jgi:hypothetical protein
MKPPDQGGLVLFENIFPIVLVYVTGNSLDHYTYRDPTILHTIISATQTRQQPAKEKPALRHLSGRFEG